MKVLVSTSLVGVLLAIYSVAVAQVVEPPPRIVIPEGSAAGREEIRPRSELLQQLVFDYSSDATLSRVKVAKFWLEPLEGKFFPLYFFSNPALLLPADKDEANFTARELLNQIGGLINLAVSRPILFPGSVAGQIGPQMEIRGGGKYVQFPPESDDKLSGTVVGQLGASFSWFMRLWGATSDERRDRPDLTSQRGLITLNARGTGNFLGGDRYRAMFRDTNGDDPPSLLGSIQFDASIHFFDQVFLTTGYTLSSSNLVEGKGFAGFSLSRRPAPAAN